MSKYDWSKVPDHVNWISTNEGGYAFGTPSKPVSGYLHAGFWYGGGEQEFILWPNQNKFNESNWRESLEERPK